MISALLPVYERADIDFSHGLGMYVFDVNGGKYLDFSAGYAALAFGHCHPKLVEALTKQAGKLWHISNKYKIPGLLEYCKRLCEVSGFADTAFIANTGAEAVECAIKMGRRYFNEKKQFNRYRFITFEGAFHGRTMACISAGSEEKIKGFEPPLDGFDRVPWNDLEAVKAAVTENTAGILIEPIQGEGGMRMADHEFMQGIAKLCKEKGMLLILDEVQCGMGRTGHMFAYQMYGVTPDIVALGKGIGGGFPVSACIATAKVGSAMYVSSHGSTFGGNPLAVSVASCALEMMDDEFLRRIRKTSAYLKERLDGLMRMHPDVIKEITGCGLMLGIVLDEKYDCNIASKMCLSEYLMSMPASNNVLRITPPLIVNEEHCDEAIAKFEKVIGHLKSPGEMFYEKIKRKVKKFASKLGLY